VQSAAEDYVWMTSGRPPMRLFWDER